MVIHDINVERIAFFPAEYYSPLVVNSQTPKSCQVTFKFLQPVSRRLFQGLQINSCIQLVEQPLCLLAQFLRKPTRMTAIHSVVNILRRLAGEVPNH
jgi:hypothetical protein